MGAIRIEFQSLIGTIKTIMKYAEKIVSKEFQSLIGTIKTYLITKGFSEVQTFQSLIGTIKTFLAQSHHRRKFSVSIPYRDDKNGGQSKQSPPKFLVSIPYRDDKNKER